MTQLSKQSIRRLCLTDKPMIYPFMPSKVVINGKSAGLSSASYDARIAHDLVLGVNPGNLVADHLMKYENFSWGVSRLVDQLRENPPYKSLAHTIENFHMPDNVSAAVADKSSYARVFTSAFNTFFDPGFRGNATLELVNFGDEPVIYNAGDPVCQFIFTWLDEPTEEPYRGKYQNQTAEAHPARYEGPAWSHNRSTAFARPECEFTLCKYQIGDAADDTWLCKQVCQCPRHKTLD